MNVSLALDKFNISIEKKRLFENVISLGAIQIISYVIPLISLPYLSRVLGVEHFGSVFFAYAFMQYFMILTDFGFNLSAVREIAVNRDDNHKISEIFNSVFLIKSFLLTVSFIILMTLILTVPKFKSDSLIYYFSFLMVAGNAFFPAWFFQGMERMKYITFLNILSKTVFLVLIFVFIKHPSDYIWVPLLNSLGFILAAILGIYISVKDFNVKIFLPKIDIIKKQFKYSIEFFISRVSLSFYTNTNTFCLGLIGSDIMVGYYAAAEKLYGAFSYVYAPVSNSLYPFMSKNKNTRFYKKVFALSVFINTITCILLFVFAKNIVSVFYGAEMLNAYKVLRIFSLVIIFDVPSFLLGYPLLGGLGYTKEANSSVIISSILHIIGLLALYLTGKMNIYSIACMVFITIFFVFSLRVYYVWKYKLLSVDIELQ